MKRRHDRAALVVFLSALGVAATFGACGDPDLSPEADASVDVGAPDAPSDTLPPVDAQVDRAAPDALADATTDAPTRAPFGLDARPANTTCKAPARPPRPSRAIRYTQVFQGAGLDQPTVLAQIPGDRTRFFAAERGGTVVSFAAQNPTSKRLVATMPEPVNTTYEGGLLGMAFHPRFAQNGYVYFLYTRFGGARPSNMQTKVVRMRSPDNGLTFVDPVTILGPFDKEDVNHCGGDLHFGPDGFLYASVGDGGDQANAQSTQGFLAKILRLDVDSAFPYAIPQDNPFRTGGGEPTTYAYGFRNPYRFSIDPVTGQVWAGDVGQAAWEEVDKVVPGGNYGWNEREGAHCNPLVTQPCKDTGFVEPYWEYPHGVGAVVIGGPVYRGTKLTEHVGRLFVADFNYSWVKTLADDPVTGKATEIDVTSPAIAEAWIGFAEDNDRELYLINVLGGVYALDEEPAPPGPAPTFPDKLSKTGCFDAQDPKKPAGGLVPYAPVSPFWSDGAEKDRSFAIPDGTTITVAANGHLDLPVGTVLTKTFRMDGKRVETRLFVRHDDGGWGGYSYEWNDAETDATLLPAGKTKALPGGKTWIYPSRGECMSCHTQAAGYSLGLEVGQLNSDFVYEATNRISNQLATMDRIGLFSQPLAPVATLPAYPSPTGQAPVEARARSYLHANCAQCHRPGGPTRATIDLRFDRTFLQTGLCNGAPLAGDVGQPGAKLLVPGNPAQSVLTKRLGGGPAIRMPPLASRVVDTNGTQLVEAWVRGLTSCPQ